MRYDRAMRLALLATWLVLTACESGPRPNRTENDPSHKAPPAAPTPCGAKTCATGEICVPGGATRNGIGDTVQLPPDHCEPLPAACGGVASCGCVDALCKVGGCASVDGGRLQCLAG